MELKTKEEFKEKNNLNSELNVAGNNQKINNQKENKQEEIFENMMGFSAFVNGSKNEEKELEKKIEKEIKKENNIELKKQEYKNQFLAKMGLEISENNSNVKRHVTTKKISKKEAKDFNEKYRIALKKKKEEQRKKIEYENKRKKELYAQNNKKTSVFKKIFPFFHKNTKNDIIKNNPELRKIREEINKEKKEVNKLFKKKQKDEFVEDFKVDVKKASKNIKKETFANLGKANKLIKKNTINLIKTNILNTINRRKNILSLLVIIPIIILLSMNISLIKDILTTNKAINNAKNLKKLTENLNNESEELEKQIEELKKELKTSQEDVWKDGQIEAQQ